MGRRHAGSLAALISRRCRKPRPHTWGRDFQHLRLHFGALVRPGTSDWTLPGTAAPSAQPCGKGDRGIGVRPRLRRRHPCLKEQWGRGSRSGVAGELAALRPVRARHVLDDDVDLLGRRLGDVDHRLGERDGQVPLLLDAAAFVHLDGHNWHAALLRVRGRSFRPGRRGTSPRPTSAWACPTAWLRWSTGATAQTFDERRHFGEALDAVVPGAAGAVSAALVLLLDEYGGDAERAGGVKLAEGAVGDKYCLGRRDAEHL